MYEKVVEGESYMKELLGASKSKEDIAGLLKTTGVLTSRYGNIYVRFGQPASLKEFLARRGFSAAGATPDAVRTTIEALGYDITHKIGAIAVVAPSPVVSTVMLPAREPLSIVEIARRAREIVDLVKVRPGVKLSPAMHDLGGAVRECVSRFLRDGMLTATARAGETLYAASPRGRLQLDYYKNSLIHFLLPTAIAAATIRSFEGHAAPRDEVFKRAKRLRELLRYEFSYEVNVTFDDVFAREVQQVVALGFIEMDGDTVKLRPEAEQLTETLAALLENFLESYSIAAEALALLRRKPLDKKEFVAKAQDLGHSMLDRGKITLVESLSKMNIENALSLFIKLGIVIEEEQEPEGDGKKKKKPPALVRLADDPEINKQVQKIRNQLLMYLGRRPG
jgi:glycerol-3-phosphate O-acyltransferase